MEPKITEVGGCPYCNSLNYFSITANEKRCDSCYKFFYVTLKR